ncbi:hypothetical protein BDV32DRAFT_77017 [Aspergillus pseudonomiae]|nr:hypothetical protein BDV32DRAFT_77017 [Aspergillus pseudonomiae]
MRSRAKCERRLPPWGSSRNCEKCGNIPDEPLKKDYFREKPRSCLLSKCRPFLPRRISHLQPKNPYRKRTVSSESEIDFQCSSGSTPICRQYLSESDQ